MLKLYTYSPWNGSENLEMAIEGGALREVGEFQFDTSSVPAIRETIRAVNVAVDMCVGGERAGFALGVGERKIDLEGTTIAQAIIELDLSPIAD